MAEKTIANSRCIYIHETGKWPSHTVDIHHIVYQKKRRWHILACFSALVLLLNTFYLLLGQVCCYNFLAILLFCIILAYMIMCILIEIAFLKNYSRAFLGMNCGYVVWQDIQVSILLLYLIIGVVLIRLLRQRVVEKGM